MERGRETRETQPWALPGRKSSSAARPPRAGGRGDAPFRPTEAPRPARYRSSQRGNRSVPAARATRRARAGGPQPGTIDAGRAPGRPQDRAPGALQALRPLMEPIVRQLPIGLNKRGRANKDAAGLLAGWPAQRSQASQIRRSQAPALPGLTIPGPAMRDGRSRDPPDPESGLARTPAALDGGRWPGCPSKAKSQGPDNERPRPAGYARPGGKPGPGGGGKGRSDRGGNLARGRPLSPDPVQLSPGRGPAALRQNQGSRSFRGRKPDRKKPGA